MDDLFSTQNVLLLLRKWRWIGTGAAVSAVVAAAVLLAQPRTYTATVDVVPRRARIEQSAIAPGDEALDAALAAVAQEVEKELRELQGRLAEQQAAQRDFQQQRDIAWESYTSLYKKVEEALVASVGGAGNEVTVASQSVIAEPQSRRLAVILPLAGALGAAAVAGWLLLSVTVSRQFLPAPSSNNGQISGRVLESVAAEGASPIRR
ncbi:MAG: hypothetical protein HY332_11090 [Chloroflexi bacterium]|nr:hypothetical protein [Chloroflexota bacterium]